ncbi:hypothetical protein D5085_09825 [Ectothiorhodospiraceae bacterium BW-2]|nr:hypothetical protein D5085_09825 [Ectothiorhodospiraceae bacterium BW-2]
MPSCWIIAGPNGAGKTTFALEYLPKVIGCYQFVNADLIAAGLSPLAPEQATVAASRMFLSSIENHLTLQHDFAFETTLSGRGYLRLIRRLQSNGWRVHLLYLALPDVELSRLRVLERVRHGGHDIPIAAIERRFPKSLNNLLNHYSANVDSCRCYMNAGGEPVLIFEQFRQLRRVVHLNYFQLLQQKATL